MTDGSRYLWAFKRRFRANLLGWRSSRFAIERLRQAVTEIHTVKRRDPALAAEGVVSLAERIWPTLEHVDTSSGILSSAVKRTLNELIPIVANIPADRKKRDRWLNRLWQAIQTDGANYLSPVEEAWGELCGSAEISSGWANRLLPLLQASWSDTRPGNYVKGTDVCLSSLLRAERYQELLDILSLKPHPIWPWRRYGIRALRTQMRLAEALAYAEGSRGMNIPDSAVDAECEMILLAAGHRVEAYRRYALTANQAITGLETFRQIIKKYPEINPKQILCDLAESSGNPGKWFAAAKDSRHLNLALSFASTGRTDPQTLIRASRDFLKSDATFS